MLRIGVRIAAIALVALVAALVLGWTRLVPVSFTLLGAAYALYLGVDDVPLDVAAPVFAAGLFVAAELAYWSLEERDEVRAESGEALRRLGIVAGLGVLVLLVAGGLLAFADVAHTGGLAIDLLGAAAAAAALLLVMASARR